MMLMRIRDVAAPLAAITVLLYLLCGFKKLKPVEVEDLCTP
jgi:hypothetical protein